MEITTAKTSNTKTNFTLGNVNAFRRLYVIRIADDYVSLLPIVFKVKQVLSLHFLNTVPL